MIAGMLLAAGRSRRFGSDKLLAPWRGHAVVRWSARALSEAVDQLYVVVPPEHTRVVQVLRGLDAIVVVNYAHQTGMASSIRAGVAALPEACDAVIVALGDQPSASGGVTAALRDRWRAERPPAVVPRYRDGRGHPVLFGRACFPDLLALSGDVGARSVLDALGAEVAEVAIEGDAPADVDTPEALAALAAAPRRET